MASLNRCTFIGNLGRDPEIKYLPSGDVIANIAIGVTEKWKDKEGNQKEETEWVRVEFFGKLAEIVGQYLKKGASVYVEGSMKTRKYTDKDGVEKYTTSIKGQSMQMLGSKPEGAGAPAQRPAPTPAPRPAPKPAGGNVVDDDIPF